MKLIKYIPVAIFSVLLMVSCNSNDEKCEKVMTNKAISYSTGNTRLADNLFENGDVFSVWANYRDNDETEMYIDNQQVALTNNVWSPNKNYFWPIGGAMDFYAVYPAPEVSNKNSVNKITVTTDNTVPTLRYHIKDFSEDLDLLAAKSSSIACPSDQLVPLHFKHLLGKMRLQVTNECEFGVPLDVHVTSMTISARAYEYGILDWETMTLKPDNAPFAIFKHEKSAYEIPARQTMTVGTYYVIPGVVKDFTVKVNWQIMNGGVVALNCEATKNFSSEYIMSSGTVKNINFVLRRAVNADETSTGDVVIEE